MEAASTSETSVTSTRLHCATTQKTAICTSVNVLLGRYPTEATRLRFD
jgi:hypothetical protein